MTTYVARRLLAAVPVLILVSFVVFALTLLIPGDPARTIAGQQASPATVAVVRHTLGLDEPFLTQYLHWLGNAITGNLGTSLNLHDPVTRDIAQRFPVTMSLALGALFLTIVIGLPAGVLAGSRPRSLGDRSLTVASSAGLAIPDFFLAFLLVSLFAVRAHWFPASQYVSFTADPWQWTRHLILPWLALGVSNASSFARQTRSAVAEAMEQDYIRTATAKGLKRPVVIYKHALKNAAIAPLTVLGIQFAYLLGGTVIIEYTFGLNGLGRYFFDGLFYKDLPVIQGVSLLSAVIFIVMNLLVDIAYAFVNPKVRLA
jgi:peptide/nickel transport system permease protein